MGMITKVKSRVQSMHSRNKTNSTDSFERRSQTVCLLSVIFLLPYCSSKNTSLLFSLNGCYSITYSLFVLPAIISANYKYPTKILRKLLALCMTLKNRWSKPMWSMLCTLYSPIHKMENFLIKMANVVNLCTQLIFFTMCDQVLLSSIGDSSGHDSRRNINGLYSLMFYNVVLYCVTYVRELLNKQDWSLTVNVAKHSNIKHVAISVTKFLLEWTKAITFIITVTFMFMVFTLEQGVQYYQPTALYTFATWTYYMCTEKFFVELFPALLLLLKFKPLEDLEIFYAPVLLHYYTIGLAALLVLIVSLSGGYCFALVAFYVTVYLRLKGMVADSLRRLRSEQAVLSQFRHATRTEVRHCDDVCSICLCHMSRARVTPCNHYFHGNCLRQCLSVNNSCPICKRDFVFVR